MKIYTLILAILGAPLFTLAADDIALTLGWAFTFQGKEYDSQLSRSALLSSPSWSPTQSLPLSTSNAVEIARTEVVTFAGNATNWQVSAGRRDCRLRRLFRAAR